MIREILLEADGDGLEAHILSFYEDVNMPLGEMREVFEAVLNGHLEERQEKMDADEAKRQAELALLPPILPNISQA